MTTARNWSLAAIPLALLLALVGFIYPSAASADDAGWIRLAHLSPDTPKVDVYLTSFAHPDPPVVLTGVGYGTVSDYQRIAPGTYTIAMRAQGAAPTAAPVLSTTVKVVAGRAYTVAGVGRNSDLVLSVIEDERVSPPPGKGRVRVVQASSDAPSVDITTSDGTTIVDDAQFPTTTAYAAVPAGRWTLLVKPVSGAAAPVTLPLEVRAGSVYSLVVLDRQNADGIEVAVHLDSAGAAVKPSGGVRTGLGGLDSPSHSSIPVGFGLLLVLLGTAGLVWRSVSGARR